MTEETAKWFQTAGIAAQDPQPRGSRRDVSHDAHVDMSFVPQDQEQQLREFIEGPSQPPFERKAQTQSSAFPFFEPGDIRGAIAAKVYETTKERATSFFNLYAKIDLIRPYFDVDGTYVLKRLAYSLMPQKQNFVLESVNDLYGPTMLVFTLVSILLLGMKISGTQVNEGTLMGTSFGVCFSYWTVASFLFYFASYLFSMGLRLYQCFSLVGYGLFGYCAALFIHCLFGYWTSVFSLVLFGGLSSLSLATVVLLRGGYASQSPETGAVRKKQAAIGAAVVFLVHFGFLLYLRLYYAGTANAVAEVILKIEEETGMLEDEPVDSKQDETPQPESHHTPSEEGDDGGGGGGEEEGEETDTQSPSSDTGDSTNTEQPQDSDKGEENGRRAAESALGTVQQAHSAALAGADTN